MKPELEEQIAEFVENGHELLFMDPRETYDECLVGIVERFNNTFLVYSRACVIKKLGPISDDEDAEEFYAFNILGAWVGEGTPGFLVEP